MLMMSLEKMIFYGDNKVIFEKIMVLFDVIILSLFFIEQQQYCRHGFEIRGGTYIIGTYNIGQ